MDLTQKFGITGIEIRARGLALLAPCIEKLSAFCCERDLVLKRQAVLSLGKIGDVASLDFMESLLAEDSDTVKDAAKAIALVEDESVVPRLLKALYNSPPALQVVLVPSLGSFSCSEVNFALSGILTDTGMPTLVKLSAAKAMGSIGDSSLSPALLDSLCSAPADLQVAALKSLAIVAYESEAEAYEILKTLFTEGAVSHPKVRSAVISALKPMTGDSHLQLVKMGLKDSNPRVVANSVDVLGKMSVNPRKLISLLKPMLEDVSNSRIRANIAVAINPHDPGTGSSILSGLLNSSDKLDRASAAYAARFVKNDSMAMWLTTLLGSEDDSDVISNIYNSLACFDASDIFDALVKFLSNGNPLIRSGAARALGRIGNSDSLDNITNALKEEDDVAVLGEMLTALGKLGDPSLVGTISEYLQHTDLRVQANCVEALNAIGTVEIVPFVEPFLNSSDNRVKANAAVALWSMGSLDVLKSLCEMLGHLNLKQRSSAAYAIGEIGNTLHNLKNEPNKYYFLISALKEKDFHSVVESTEAVDSADDSRQLPTPDLSHFLDMSTGISRSAVNSSEPKSGYPLQQIERYFSLIESRQNTEAKAYLDSCINNDSENIFYKYLKADYFRLSQNVIRASEAFVDFENRSRDINEPFLNAHIHLANVCTMAHEQGQSVRAYFSALKVQLEIINSEVEMGLALLDDEEVNEASLLLKNLVSRIPLNGKLHYIAGRNFLKGKCNEEAFVNLFKAYLLAPDSGEVLLGLAFSCYKTKRYSFVRLVADKLKGLLGETSPMTIKVLDLVSALDKAGL